MLQIGADFGINGIDSLLQCLQCLRWRNFPSPEKIPKLDDAKRRQIALRHSSRCLTESLKPTSWSRSLRFSSGERTRSPEKRCRGAITPTQSAPSVVSRILDSFVIPQLW